MITDCGEHGPLGDEYVDHVARTDFIARLSRFKSRLGRNDRLGTGSVRATSRFTLIYCARVNWVTLRLVCSTRCAELSYWAYACRRRALITPPEYSGMVKDRAMVSVSLFRSKTLEVLLIRSSWSMSAFEAVRESERATVGRCAEAAARALASEASRPRRATSRSTLFASANSSHSSTLPGVGSMTEVVVKAPESGVLLARDYPQQFEGYVQGCCVGHAVSDGRVVGRLGVEHVGHGNQSDLEALSNLIELGFERIFLSARSRKIGAGAQNAEVGPDHANDEVLLRLLERRSRLLGQFRTATEIEPRRDVEQGLPQARAQSVWSGRSVWFGKTSTARTHRRVLIDVDDGVLGVQLWQSHKACGAPRRLRGRSLRRPRALRQQGEFVRACWRASQPWSSR